MNDKTNTLKSAIYGLAVGDALGVPYEFKSRGAFECTDMIGYGTHNQPEGTWSDDTNQYGACHLRQYQSVWQS